jgi:histidyl-tRNA synthetase
MIPDAEAIKVMVDILTALDIGDFVVKMNHRKILDGMFQVCGVPSDMIRSISSAVDKLDKMTWESVKREMVNEKGLDEKVADKIGKYVCLNGIACSYSGRREVCQTILNDPDLSANESIKQGIADMELLFVYLDLFKVSHRISFDLSLARGLDYYTGIIYESVLTTHDAKTSGIGSLAAGGRYDNLVGMFGGPGKEIPCVGISLGVERLFAIIDQKMSDMKPNATEVYVAAIDGLLEERMKIAEELWANGINAEFQFKTNGKLGKQLALCEKTQIPVAVIIGSTELEKGIVKVKDILQTVEYEIPRETMVSKIKQLLSK